MSSELSGQVREAIAAARVALAGDADALARLDEVSHRLNQPLRVALAGSIKAGKSTLLNALVGQEIAPTDATECTRVITWYRNGVAPKVTSRLVNGFTAPVRMYRTESGLSFDLSGTDLDQIDALNVEWPASDLAAITIVDTPGMSSVNQDISARTFAMLTPKDEASGADAVVYLLRNLTAPDVSFLRQVTAHVGAESGSLGVIGVVSRADESGAGRLDAMASARDISERFATELERTGLCQAVVPVAGLLALAARTLTEAEFEAFRALAGVDGQDLQLWLLSADRFSRADCPLPGNQAMRASLVRRFGIFGIRMSITLINNGISDSPSLVAALLERSGLNELREVLDVQFGQRAEQLKTHSALVALERIVQHRRGTEEVAQSVGRLLANSHDFAELRLLGRLRITPLQLPDADYTELYRMVGGTGTSAEARLSMPHGSSPKAMRVNAITAVRKWRARAKHPLIDRFTASACELAARSAEGIVFELA